MARGVFLNTATRNLLDLLGNGRVYRVPSYQRDYSWQEEQWEDLWNDILELRGNRDDRHYMGALVVEGTSDREFSVIDGQQRLATLSIAALAILKRLETLAESGNEPDRNRERARELRKRFIGDKDPASLVESSKLFLNENDNGFYQDYLVQLRTPRNPRNLSRSNKLLWECFQYFEEAIEAENALADSGTELAVLLSEHIARQLMFIIITVDDELNAYTVFETLNARGLELSATDLLKNYLFSRVKTPADQAALQRRWKTLVTTVRQERFPEFLRYHLLCEQPKVRTQRLYKVVRDRIGGTQDVFDLIDALEARADLFAALRDPNDEFWTDFPDCRVPVQELKMYGVRQLTPVIFAAKDRLKPKDFAKVLKTISVVAFRHTVVSGLNTNELEPVSHFAAKAILSGAATTPAQVFEHLRKVYVDDDRFIRTFESLETATHGRQKRLVKYILCKLESDAAGRPCDHLTDPATIEHVLPENPGEEWESVFPPEHWERFVCRIGNLTLLEARLNRQIGNANYGDKLKGYGESNYRLTQNIGEHAPEEWTPELLEKRQRELAKRAAHVWRVDYP